MDHYMSPFLMRSDNSAKLWMPKYKKLLLEGCKLFIFLTPTDFVKHWEKDDIAFSEQQKRNCNFFSSDLMFFFFQNESFLSTCVSLLHIGEEHMSAMGQSGLSRGLIPCTKWGTTYKTKEVITNKATTLILPHLGRTCLSGCVPLRLIPA